MVHHGIMHSLYEPQLHSNGLRRKLVSKLKNPYICALFTSLLLVLTILFGLSSSGESVARSLWPPQVVDSIPDRVFHWLRWLFHYTTVVQVDVKQSVQIPESLQLNDSMARSMAEQESNVAAHYFETWKELEWSRQRMRPSVTYCDLVQLSDPFKVKHNNLLWQELDVKLDKMFLFNAYYDKRIKVVKLIGTFRHEMATQQPQWWCLLWFDLIKSPVLSKGFNRWPLGRNTTTATNVQYDPQLIDCAIPQAHAKNVPRAVSLQIHDDCYRVERIPSNVLRVIYNSNNKIDRFIQSSHTRSIGVCVQAVHFANSHDKQTNHHSSAVWLVEWLEMVRLMGADRVYLYGLSTNDNNIQQVLRYYRNEGFVDWRWITLPGDQPNVESLYTEYAPKMDRLYGSQQATIELNDCFYRNLYRHEYLVMIDINQMILPEGHANWHQLIEKIENKLSPHDLSSKAYYVIGQAHEQTDQYSRHRQMSSNQSAKKRSIIIPTLNLSNEKHQRDCLSRLNSQDCKVVTVDLKDARLEHYRPNTSSQVNNFQNKDCVKHFGTAWRAYYNLLLPEMICRQLRKIFV